MDLSKLSNEELLKLKVKIAGEVSKKTCSDSIGESRVQDFNPAPILIPKPISYNSNIKLQNLEMKSIDYKISKKFIEMNHYSQRMSVGVKSNLGFFLEKELVTVILYSVPVCNQISKFLQVKNSQVLELTRLASLDILPKNTESYCLGQSFKFLKQNYPQYKYLISYADPNHGHLGYIYQATNWKYIGLQRRNNTHILLLDGKEVHERKLSHIHGTNGYFNLKKIYGDRIILKKQLKKHIYIMCLGNHKECKEWYSKFKFLPYPKAHNDIIEGKVQ